MNPSAPRRRLPAALLAAITLLALVSGCSSPQLARVQPWERAHFTEYGMSSDRDPLATAMSEHIYYSREASAGGRGVGGAGCGCN